ncbi:hypothetical protein NKG05_18790 [Oerskovia sp. M15]
MTHLDEAALLWDRDPSSATDLAVAPGLGGPRPVPCRARPVGPVLAAGPRAVGDRPGVLAGALDDLLASAPPGPAASSTP